MAVSQNLFPRMVIMNRADYGHLLQGGLKVKVGDRVTAGQTIGLMGNTGISTGTHLHFEIKLDGKHVDPKEYMKNLTTAGGR